MTIAKTEKVFRKMHVNNWAQSRAIDKWLKVATNPGNPECMQTHAPIFNKVNGQEYTYDKVLWKWFNTRKSAHKRGIRFALAPVSIMNMLNAKKCFYTGIPLTPGARSNQSAKHTDFTIDRIDSSIGYVPGNVVACCHLVNNLKGILEGKGGGVTPREMKIIVETAKEMIYNSAKGKAK